MTSITQGAGLPTLVDLLQMRASDQANQQAYYFLRDGEQDEQALTYAELDRRARSIALQLQALGGQGQSVVLLCPPGLDYIAAFFGCLYAGSIAVPLYPPRNNRSIERLLMVVSDAQATIALANSSLLLQLQKRAALIPELQKISWLPVDQVSSHESSEDWKRPAIRSESLALLQYTSGSTSVPKGVMLTHANLLHNLHLIQKGFAHTPESRGMLWLPPFHDMGLIGGILQPLFVGFPITLMSPTAFLQRPLRWLEAISRSKATTSGGPNFAYDLCVEKYSPEQASSLDLSSWNTAFVGAEPIRPTTLARFAETFAPSGFDKAAFYHCYGLAEATLIVSGGYLQQNQRVIEQQSASCGNVLDGWLTTVVDPVSQVRCAPNEVGEIWLQGPGVAMGYWRKPEATEETFHATLADTGEGPFLRTGDLGLLSHNELYVTGRLKDLIILRGRNYYPQDIELLAEHAHSACLSGSCAAFSVEKDGEEQLVVVQELHRSFPQEYLQEVVVAINKAIAEQSDLMVSGVVLIKQGSIPKTSSGKIQRFACKQVYLTGGLAVLKEWKREQPPSHFPGTEKPDDLSPQGIEHWLTSLLARLLGIPATLIRRDEPIGSYGLDSLLAVDLLSTLTTTLGVTLSLEAFFQQISLAELAMNIFEQLPIASPSPISLPSLTSAPVSTHLYPISYNQRAMWVMYQLAPQSAAYTIAGVARVGVPLDLDVFAQVLADLTQRHEMLRMTFCETEEGIRQYIHENMENVFVHVDGSGWTAAYLQQYTDTSGHRTFDLVQGPLFQLTCITRSAQESLLVFAAHHSILDLWSISNLLKEIAEDYTARLEQREPDLLVPPARYVDFVDWHKRLLESSEGERLWQYWQQQVANASTVLELPTNRSRPAIQTFEGARFLFSLSPELVHQLKQLSQTLQGSLFMTLMVGFHLFLSRYTRQSDILVGTETAGRALPQFASIIGYFANPLLIRSHVAETETVQEYYQQVRQTIIKALEHQHFPFSLLVERLQVKRDPSRSPLFQIAFNFYNASFPHRPALVPTSFVGRQKLFEESLLPLELLPLLQKTAQQDITLAMSEFNGQVSGEWQYNTDLFDAQTIELMTQHFLALLADLAAHKKIDTLSFITAQERRLLEQRNATNLLYNQECRVSDLFEAQVRRTPDAKAIIFNDQSLSYAELDLRASQLAHVLLERGVGPDVLVGMCMERSLEIIIAIWGILKAGGAYVPLDPAHPAERLHTIIEQAHIPLVLVHRSYSSSVQESSATLLVWEALQDELLNAPTRTTTHLACADNLAYVIHTSGSTGTPKGVMIAQRNVVNLCMALSRLLGENSQGHWLAIANIAFDASILEVIWTLTNGFTIVMQAHQNGLPLLRATQGRPDYSLLAHLKRYPDAHMQCTPSFMNILLEDQEIAPQLRSLSRLLIGAEAVPPALVAKIRKELPSCTLWHMYGPTETTVWSSASRIEDAQEVVPLGLPIANTQIYQANSVARLSPVGVPGEILIAGDGVARGYLEQPALTAEHFVPDPFSTRPGARMYRTGDLGRNCPDGTFTFFGRLDYQIKIRGFRVEPGEIEAALCLHPAIQQAVVVKSGEGTLAAYVVGEREYSFAPTAMRDFLRGKVPAYMVPAAFVLLDSLPLNANGKINRHALPEPEYTRSEETPFVAPRTPTEQRLREIWEEVLHIKEISVLDHFFQLGGHSLLATQVISRLRSGFQIELPLSSIFEYPTLAELASSIEHLQPRNPHTSVPLLPLAHRAQPVPLSFAQQRLWFLHQLEPENAAYNISLAFSIHGVLNIEALEKSFQTLADRYEILRTCYRLEQNQPVQVILSALQFQFDRRQIEGETLQEQQERAHRFAVSAGEVPFDLSIAPLWRVSLLTLQKDESIVVLIMHHSITDGWSLNLLMREIAVLYKAYATGREVHLSPLSLQYADYALWQRAWLQGEVLTNLREYWKHEFQHVPAMLPLPIDHPRPLIQTSRGRTLPVMFSSDLTAALRKIGIQEGVSLFTILLAAFDVLLYRYTAQEDIVVGTSIAGRNRIELEQIPGFFVNTLALHTRVSANWSFREILQNVHKTMLNAYEYQDLPFEHLIEELHIERSLSHTPLFQVLFVLQNTIIEPVHLFDLDVELFRIANRTAKYDLVLDLTEKGEQIEGTLEYNCDLFETGTIERLIAHFVRLTAALVASSDSPIAEHDMLSEAEERLVLQGWNDTARGEPESGGFLQVFAENAHTFADAIAFSYGDELCSYRQLDLCTNRIARTLQRAGIRQECLVALLGQRRIPYLSLIPGIWKAGGVYLPLDPQAPEYRLEQIIQQSHCAYLIADQAYQEKSRRLLQKIPEKQRPLLLCLEEVYLCESDEAPLPIRQTPKSLAYVMYTSGSTGIPKGVMVEHSGMLNHMYAKIEDCKLNCHDVVAQNGPQSFDVFLWQAFAALLVGARVEIIPEEAVRDPARFLDRLERTGVVILQVVPSALHTLLRQIEWHTNQRTALCQLRWLIPTGDALPTELWKQWFAHYPSLPLLNTYGSTECSDDQCHYLLPQLNERDLALNIAPIGTPIRNMRVYVLDARQKPVPIGVVGELYIGGLGVGRGYLSDPERTAQVFLPDPFSSAVGARMYKTSDRVRQRADGSLEFLGRLDHLVKIRGFRIETAEVETVLKQHESVHEALVTAYEAGVEDKRLIAYIVPQKQKDTKIPLQKENPQQRESQLIQSLQKLVQKRLPSYMHPGTILEVDALPLNANGKINRKELPLPDSLQPISTHQYIAPATPIEQRLVEIWTQILGISQIGIQDNFFELGGHSLLATQCMLHMREEFRLEFSLVSFFQEPTIANLAREIELQQRVQEEQDLEAMLEFVENLSDEHVQELTYELEKQHSD